MKKASANRLAVFEEAVAEAVDEAEFLRNLVENFARFIAARMEEMHETPFRVVVDHDVGMVLVRKV